MKKVLNTHIVLLSPFGNAYTPIQIAYDENSLNPKFEASLVYDGIEYKGKGTDYCWTDTLADLEIQLPQNVQIACCTTCRHGNMCPYGLTENLLFCTKDLKINSKEDVCNLFDETDPFKERAVASLDYCENFTYQNDECYTYNDYLYYLHRRMEILKQ